MPEAEHIVLNLIKSFAGVFTFAKRELPIENAQLNQYRNILRAFASFFPCTLVNFIQAHSAACNGLDNCPIYAWLPEFLLQEKCGLLIEISGRRKIIMLEILLKSGIGQNMAQIKRRAAEYSIIGQLLFGCYRRQQLTSRIIIQCLQTQLCCPPPENRALASKHFPFHKPHITAA